MISRIWKEAIETSADPKRARHFLDLLLATEGCEPIGSADSRGAQVFTSLFSGSPVLSSLLRAHPDWMRVVDPEQLQHPRRKQGLRHEVGGWLEEALKARDYPGALSRLREFKQREMLRIAARDLAGVGELNEVIQDISDVADVCLDGVWRICQRQFTERYGQPFHPDASGKWQPTRCAVLGMGKLGGQELNYSSDVDLLVVYTEEGGVFKEPPRGKTLKPALRNHQFFNRLVEAFTAEVTRLAPEGFLYRVDFRLRPEGDSGPLSRALSSYENYYAAWGQSWERMMLIKARGVAGDESLAVEFLEMAQPFRYPRSLNENFLQEVAAMKDRIENEVVKTGELERNVKLGQGGIREIEFIAQSLQLLHGGRQPFLQGARTVPCLEKLAQYELLRWDDARELSEAYAFLRRLEHRLQMEQNLQTHTLPNERSARERLGRLMGFEALPQFDKQLKHHTGNVRRIFEAVLKPELPARVARNFPPGFEGTENEWKEILAEHRFKDVDKAFRTLREFVEGPGYVHVSPRTAQLALQLLPRLFKLCAVEAASGSGKGKVKEARKRIPLSDPDRVVTRLDSFIAVYGARSTLFELWNSNPSIFDLLLLLFDRSEFLAELAIRTPDLVDELVTSGRLRQRKQAMETLRDLRHGLADEDQSLWLRRYHQAELMRIGLRDILGLADDEQYLTELSGLADACLQYALEVVMSRAKLKKPPFAIIGLGKLGGAEIDYGSDLDILFVADKGAKSLARLAPFAQQVMDMLSTRTEHGLVFHTDARLRPDGEKGLLVNTLAAYEEYYRQRAQLWEIQSLTRTRFVAGDPVTGDQFETLAGRLSNFASRDCRPAAYGPDWKEQIHKMRLRIETERTPKGKGDLAIKTGSGGLMDAEFVAQALCMERGLKIANTMTALERARDAGALPEADKLIGNYRELRRVEGILRRWSYEGETVLPDDAAPYYRVSVRCGYGSPEEFRASMAKCRAAVREVYLKVFRF